MHICKVGLYFLATLVAGCKAPLAYELQVERGVKSDEVTQITEAVADWEDNIVELRVDMRPARGGCAGRFACITVDFVDDYTPEEGGSAQDIIISRLISRADTGRALRHRLGHAMGLGHYGPNTIMDDNPNTWTWVVMPRDVAMWRALR